MNDEKVSNRVIVLRKWHKHAKENCFNEPQTVIAFAAEIRASERAKCHAACATRCLFAKRQGQAELITKLKRVMKLHGSWKAVVEFVEENPSTGKTTATKKEDRALCCYII